MGFIEEMIEPINHIGVIREVAKILGLSGPQNNYKVKVRRVTAWRKGLRDVFISRPCPYGMIQDS